MPTGYTANVPDGITFEEFVWQCARAMGAMVTMRDAPAGAPIPERFEPSDYCARRMREAIEELGRLQNLTEQQVQTECEAEHRREEARRSERLAKNEAELAAYRKMLDQVKAWAPPTDEHEQLKEFMVDQLRKSIDFDDIRNHCQPQPMLDPAEWLAKRVAIAERDITHHTEQHKEEVARTEARNRWIAALRASLAPKS